MRRLYRALGRRRDPHLRAAGVHGRNEAHHHNRRSRRRQGAPRATGVDRRRRAAVRLLPVGSDHGRRRAAGAHARALRRRHRRRHDQHLPLRDLPAHSRRDSSCGEGGVMERRAFLQITGTVGAGLVLGIRLPDRYGVLPFAPNAWLRIDPDGGVTVTIDKSEMGEGNHTALAMIVAEELDADWSKVRVGPVPENPAGWSRRMSTGGSTSVRTSWDILRRAGATARAMLVAAAAREWGADP